MVSQRHSQIGSLNRRIGWISLVVGAASGMILGLWSFDGPVPVPAWLGEYTDLPRRLARMGHIAFIGIGFLNILVGKELSTLALTERAGATASWCMIFANFLLPATLFAASLYSPAKYALPLPATAVFIALSVVAWGVLIGDRKLRTDKGEQNDKPSHGKRIADPDRPHNQYGHVAGWP